MVPSINCSKYSSLLPLSSTTFCYLAAAAVRGTPGAVAVVAVGAAGMAISLLVVAMVPFLRITGKEKKSSSSGQLAIYGQGKKKMDVGKGKLEVVGNSTAPTEKKAT